MCKIWEEEGRNAMLLSPSYLYSMNLRIQNIPRLMEGVKKKTGKKRQADRLGGGSPPSSLTASILWKFWPILSFIKWQNNPKYDNLSRIFYIFLTASGEGEGGSTQAVSLTAFSQFFFDDFPYPIQIYISKKILSPTLCPKGTQKLSNFVYIWHIHMTEGTNLWKRWRIVCLSVITPTFPLKTLLNHFRCFTDPHNHTYSESSWHELSTDAPVMTRRHTQRQRQRQNFQEESLPVYISFLTKCCNRYI